MSNKIHKVEQAFLVHLATIKPSVFEEATEWLKKKTEVIARSFTDELHGVITQFIEYKRFTSSRMAEVAWYRENVKILELTLARKIPVFDAEYGLSETTPLRLYDCLVPRIREHKKNYIDIR